MSREEQLAAAQMAQLFGSELLHVQKSTVHGSRDALKMHPNQFLTKNVKAPDKKIQEQMLRQIEAQARVQCPIPAPSASTTNIEQTSQRSDQVVKLLEKISISLETIVEFLQTKKDNA